MEQIIKRILLKKLQQYAPHLSSDQLTFALTRGFLALDRLALPAYPIKINSQSYEIVVEVRQIAIQLSWSQILSKPMTGEIQEINIYFTKCQHAIEELQITQPTQEQQSNRVVKFFKELLKSFINTVGLKIGKISFHADNQQTLSINQLELGLNFKYQQQYIDICIRDICLHVQIAINKNLDVLLTAITSSIQIKQDQQQIVASFGDIIANYHSSNTMLTLLHIKSIQKLTALTIQIKIGEQPPNLNVEIQSLIIGWCSLTFQEIINYIKILVTQFKQADPIDINQIKVEPLENLTKATLTLKLQDGIVNCINNNVTIGRLEASASVDVTVKQHVANANIDVINAIYYDCSNYPHTIPSMNVNSFPMIQAERLLVILEIFDDNCPKDYVQNNKYNFVRVILNQVQAMYFQQPFLRFMDFLIEQFIALIIKDFGVRKVEQCIVDQKLGDPKFTEIILEFSDAEVQIKPIPTSTEYLSLRVKKFNFKTRPTQSKTRMLCNDFPFLWEMCMDINIHQLSIDSIAQNTMRRITSTVNFNVCVTKSLFTLLYISNETEFDKTIEVHVHIDNLKLNLNRSEYLLVMRILFNNIFFDDQQDIYYKYNINTGQPQTNPPASIKAFVTGNKIQLDIQYQNLTLLELLANGLQLQFHSKPDQSTITATLQGISAIQYNPWNLQIEEQLILQSRGNYDYFIKYEQLNLKTGYKSIQIHSPEVYGNLNLDWLFTAINYFVLDDTVQIILPSDYQVLKPLQLELVIDKVVAVPQYEKDDNGFIAKGNLFVSLQKNMHNDVHRKYHMKDDTCQDNIIYKEGPTSCLKIESSHISLFSYSNDTIGREILSPVSIQWKSQNFQCLCSKQHQFLNESQLGIEKLKLQLNISQIESLVQVVRNQVQSMFEANMFGDKWHELYSQVSISSKHFYLEPIEVWLVYEKHGTITPLMTSQIEINPFLMYQSYMRLLLSANVQIECEFFNQIACQMEPIIEKISLDVLFIKNKITYPRINFIIECSKESSFSQLNINVHQNFILQLITLLNKSKLNNQKEKQELKSNKQESLNTQDDIPLYIIDNQTGYDLQIQIDDQHHWVGNASKVPVKISTNSLEYSNKFNKFNMEFVNQRKEVIKLKNLKIDQHFPIFWMQTQLQEQSKCVMYIKQHMSQMNRIIRLQSKMLIQNLTEMQLYLAIGFNQQILWQSVITMQRKIAIPSELIHERYFLYLSHDIINDICSMENQQMISIKTLFNSDITYLELQLGNNYVIINSEADAIYPQKRRFKLKPPLMIHSSIPSQLTLLVNHLPKAVDCQTMQSTCQFTLKSIITIQIQLAEIYLSDLEVIYQPFRQMENQDRTMELKNIKNEQLISIGLKVRSQDGVLELYFYPKICLINSTDIVFTYRSMSLDGIHKYIIPQITQQYSILNEQKNLILEYDSHETNQVSIKGIGETSIEIKRKNNDIYQLYEFGVNIVMMLTVRNLGIYTKIIEISPRYVVINKTNYILNVQQEDTYGKHIEILQNQRIPIIWQDCRKEKLIVVRVNTNEQLSKWSGGIFISDLRTIHFCCLRKDQDKIFLKGTISKNKAIFYFTIEEGQIPYKLHNRCPPEIQISYCQINKDPVYEPLPFNLLTSFSWQFPSLQPILSVKAISDQQNLEFQLDLFKSDKYYAVKMNQNQYLRVQIEFEQSTKIVIFSITTTEKPEDDSDNLLNIYYIHIPILTISIIMNMSKPQELNLVSLTNIEIGVSEQSRVTAYQFKIKFINIDHNYRYDPINEVLLTPFEFKKIMAADNNQSIDVKWSLVKLNEHITMIEFFNAYIEPLSVNIDEEYISLIFQLITTITRETKRNAQSDQENHELLKTYSLPKILFLEHKKKIQFQEWLRTQIEQGNGIHYEWMIISIPTPRKQLYIKHLVLPPIVVSLTYQKTYQQNQRFIIDLISNALGTALTNIQDAPIKLKGIVMENIFDTTDGIQMQLREHYKFAMIRQILPILGSFELLGSPISFFNRISTGVVDLIEKPIEAMAQGPLELGLGVIQGAASLVKNTVAGAFYSVNKITGSVGNQISMLSLDEEFIQQRIRFMSRKPTQVFEGIYFGLHSLVHSVGDGIIGLLQHPYQMGKKEGIIGVLKGSARGVVGVIIKPISGVLDVASKTAEGLCNTALQFEDRPNTLRMRDIRPFYELTRYIKPYSENDAYFISIFQTFKGGFYKNIQLIDTFTIQDADTRKQMHLILSHSMLIYMNKDKAIKWETQSGNIIEFKLFEDPREQSFYRLFLICSQTPIIKVKFNKIPYSNQLAQKLQYLIDINKNN